MMDKLYEDLLKQIAEGNGSKINLKNLTSKLPKDSALLRSIELIRQYESDLEKQIDNLLLGEFNSSITPRSNKDQLTSKLLKYLNKAETQINSYQTNESRYRSVIETAIDAIIVINADGIIQSCNNAIHKLLGYEPADIIGKNVSVLTPPEIRKEHDSYLRHHIETGEKKVIGVGREVRGMHKKGYGVDLFLSVSKMVINNAIYFTGILRDISEEKKSLADLELSKAKTNAILETAVDAIIVINDHGFIQSCNQATKQLFGYDQKDLVGKNVSVLMPEPFRSEHDGYLARYLQTGQKRIIGIGREVIGLRKDQTTFYAQLSISEVRIGGERLFTGIVRDITELKAQTEAIAKANESLQKQNKRKEVLNQLYATIQGGLSLDDISKNVLSFFSQHLPLLVAASYVILGNKLYLKAQYALNETQTKARSSFNIGEGAIGQVAQSGQIVTISKSKEATNLSLETAFGRIEPNELIIVPIFHERGVVGVIELALKESLDTETRELIQACVSSIGIAFEGAISKQNIEELLSKTQAQEEELRTNNEELIEQQQRLQQSEEMLQTQSEELKVANEELEAKMKFVEKQREEINIQKREIEDKAESLATSNQYKSEFLANMSHELRTPLNSLLILSAGLLKNREQNLLTDQLEDISVIHKSGQNLLELINDILDLSKVEAGKLDVNSEPIILNELIYSIQRQFSSIAKSKGLELEIVNMIQPNYKLISDMMRIEQIIRNLLSNSFKFTPSGKITLKFFHPSWDRCPDHLKGINTDLIAFSVSDTGIGIPKEKQKSIFAAFQQADGSTARHYGGTGLGLTISQKLSQLLGGDIVLEYSEEKKGSSFAVYIKGKYIENTDHAENIEVRKQSAFCNVSTENTSNMHILEKTRKTLNNSLLIIEDDLIFAEYIVNIAKQKNFTCQIAKSGREGLALAASMKPSSIILDLELPDMRGEEVLNQLKSALSTKHIPIHVISARSLDAGSLKGVVETIEKPIKEENLQMFFQRIEKMLSKQIKTVLIIEDDKNSVYAIKKLIDESNISIISTGNANSALNILKEAPIDCIILDYNLPDMTGYQLLKEHVNEHHHLPPTIIYTGKPLTKEEYRSLNEFTSSFFVKGAQSPERLVDELRFFLHSVDSTNSSPEIKLRSKSNTVQTPIHGSTVLLVDDDLRNCFALSKQLRKEGIKVIVADSGQLALDKLKNESQIDLILMDIMMPGMDGYEATKKIRNNEKWSHIPVIALTAKAMSEDKQKCLDAGANDYLAKPVDLDRLFDVMRVWMKNNGEQ